MPHFPLVTLTDTDLGRLDSAALPDQQMMELLIGGLPDSFQKEFRDKNGLFTAVSTWGFVKCDENTENVLSVRIFHKKMGGTLDLKYVPRGVQDVEVQAAVSGSLDTAALPDTLLNFSLYNTNFAGSVDFCTLPRALRSFYLLSANCSGTCDFSALPRKLRVLCLPRNRFQGSVALVNLPETLAEIDLKNNCFDGELRVVQLPPCVRMCDISRNTFTSLVLGAAISVVENAKSDAPTVDVNWNFISSVVDENGDVHRSAAKIMMNQRAKVNLRLLGYMK